MNTFIKLSLGIALALPLSTSITAVHKAYGIVETSSSFRALSKISQNEFGAQSAMNGEQLSAIKGMAGICISCLDEKIDRLIQILAQHGKFSDEDAGTTVNQSNQFVIGAGPVTQSNQAMVNQTMINQTFSPSGNQLSVVRVQQSQALTTQFPNQQLASNLAQEIRTSTQEIINQNLSQLQNVVLPGQSPIGNGERLAQQIITSTQEIINQSIMNGTVNTTTFNQRFTNVPRGGFLR